MQLVIINTNGDKKPYIKCSCGALNSHTNSYYWDDGRCSDCLAELDEDVVEEYDNE